MRNFDYMEDSEESSRGLVEEGVCLNFGPLSLCKIKRLIGEAYQCDCMGRISYSNLFSDFSVAFDKFKELKSALIATGYKERVYANRRSPTISKNR